MEEQEKCGSALDVCRAVGPGGTAVTSHRSGRWAGLRHQMINIKPSELWDLISLYHTQRAESWHDNNTRASAAESMFLNSSHGDKNINVQHSTTNQDLELILRISNKVSEPDYKKWTQSITETCILSSYQQGLHANANAKEAYLLVDLFFQQTPLNNGLVKVNQRRKKHFQSCRGFVTALQYSSPIFCEQVCIC